MTKGTTQSRKSMKALVSPSSRDSISGWLDVLTSMLSLPESQRLQVRDELEDHLRSRVDDLLITGTNEPEAIRTAVAELGETAELAKLISHAHSRANPRRRIMNIVLMTVAVAGLSIGGISLQNNAGTSVEETAVALAVVDAGRVDDGKVHAFGDEMKSAHAILIDIGDAFDRSVSFSRGSMSRESRMHLEVHAQFAGQFTFDQAIAKFRKQFDEVSGGYNLEITADSVLYQTNDEYERKRIEMRIYPSPVWLSKANERQDYVNSLTNLLEVKHDLKYASIEVIDEAIVVAATPELHEEVVRFSAELNAMLEGRYEERRALNTQRNERMWLLQDKERAESDKRKAEGEAEFEKTVIKLQSEFDDAREALLKTKAQLRLVESELSKIQNVFSSDRPDVATLSSQILSLKNAEDELMLKFEEDQERYSYLRLRLIESQYTQLFDSLK